MKSPTIRDEKYDDDLHGEPWSTSPGILTELTTRRESLCSGNKQWLVVLSGPGLTCSHRDPMFAGSNPAEVDGVLQDVKILSTCHPGGTLGWES